MSREKIKNYSKAVNFFPPSRLWSVFEKTFCVLSLGVPTFFCFQKTCFLPCHSENFLYDSPTLPVIPIFSVIFVSLSLSFVPLLSHSERSEESIHCLSFLRKRESVGAGVIPAEAGISLKSVLFSKMPDQVGHDNFLFWTVNTGFVREKEKIEKFPFQTGDKARQ